MSDGLRLRLEAEDYCDQKLGSFENVLQRTLQQVAAGRAKLQGNLLDELGDAPAPAESMDPLDDSAPQSSPEAQAC